jgi:sodium/bile acid cotransporter 7
LAQCRKLFVSCGCLSPLQQLGGNVSLALLLTVTTNILGIFTMPFILPHIAAAAALTGPTAATAAAAAGPGAATVVLQPLPLMLQLCQTILVPTFLGAAVRGLVPGAAAAIDKRKKLLSYINAGLLASVPWMQVRSFVTWSK